MNFLDLFLLAIGLSMDAFAVSVCKGLATGGKRLKAAAVSGLWFGGFQMMMPLIGYAAGSAVSRAVERFDHWVIFGLLVLIGLNMIREAFSDEERTDDSLSPRKMLPLAIATSIDALAAGASMAMLPDVRVVPSCAFIGTVTFLLSFLGVSLGGIIGSRFQKASKVFGGIVLILLGVKILLEHMGVI